MINRRCKSRVLVLSGPSGSGKSTLARLLANELIHEKLSSNRYEYGSRSSNKTKMSTLEIGDVEVKEEGDTSTKSENIIEYKLFSTSTSKLTSPVTNFREFLDQCKFLKNKCVLIEELPNLYHPDTLRSFQESLSDWLELSKVLDDLPVLIICITDVEIDGYDSFTSSGNGLSSSFGIERNFITETIMGPKLMEMENVDYSKGGWSHIKFNPVAKMYMKRILNTIIKNESSIIKRIPAAIFNFKFNKVFIKNGDIRNSINNLEYWCKFFYNSKYDSEYYIEIENFGDGSNNNGNNNINAIGKEVNLDLFHSIGKILYGTQHVEEEIESFLKSNNNHSLVSEEDGNHHDYVKSINFIISSNVTRDIISQFNIFNLNIIENYCNLNSMQFPIDSNLTDLIDNVSLSDVLSSIGDSINSTNLGISNNNNNFNNKLRNSNFRTTTNLISEESALISVFGSRLNLDNISKKIEILINENKISKNKNLNLKYSRDSKIKKKNNSLYSEIKNYKLNRLNNLLLSKSSNHYSYLSDTDCMLYDGFYESNILNSRKFRMKFNSGISKNNNKNNNTYNIPRVERLGGGFENLVLADNKLKLIDEDIEESDGSNLEVPVLSLNGIKKTINNNHRKISPNDLQKYEDYYFLGFADEIAGGITGDHDFDGDKSDGSEFDLDPIVNSDDDEASGEEKFQSDDEFSDSDEELLDL
ncbi:unnamed protein product [[Candida] boidinii]|uniref:Unnamed protein product n=1 Tax=Candida boidinii TaxID=5477 RepID=A0A9W6WHT5_CANBO|nr:unnamed protein product [[Candida] boidinii]